MIQKLTLIQNEELPLRDVVFQTLRKAILVGDLVPGERLMELHLSRMLGVSRTPVREAIHMLELEGLVVVVPHKGAEVASITADGMKEVLEVRRALDILCVELACDRVTDMEVDLLYKACEAFEEATRSGDTTDIAACDVEFHEIILKAARNARLTILVNNLSEQMYRYRYEYIKDADIYSQLIEEHRGIYEAIRDRDKSRAVQIAGMHIDNQEVAIMRQIDLEKE